MKRVIFFTLAFFSIALMSSSFIDKPNVKQETSMQTPGLDFGSKVVASNELGTFVLTSWTQKIFFRQDQEKALNISGDEVENPFAIDKPMNKKVKVYRMQAVTEYNQSKCGVPADSGTGGYFYNTSSGTYYCCYMSAGCQSASCPYCP